MTTRTDLNMDIWNKATPIDPKKTKQFTRGGGFKGTSINATYLFMRATEVFGPIGHGWGFSVLEEKMIEGAPLVWKDVRFREVVHTIRIRFWYTTGEDAPDEAASFEGIGQTTMVGLNKNGPYTDEEAPKKSLTDAITKALSMLGFASEIHMGLWDDNKYVNAFDRAEQDAALAAEMARQQAAVETAIKAIDEAAERLPDITTKEDFDQIATTLTAHFNLIKMKQPEQYLKFRKLFADKAKTFTTTPPEQENDHE